MKSYQIRVNPALYDSVTDYAKTHEMTMPEVVNMALRMFFQGR